MLSHPDSSLFVGQIASRSPQHPKLAVAVKAGPRVRPGVTNGEAPPQAFVSARQHRAQRLACEEVDVEVRHFLMGVHADIGEQAIAGLNMSRRPRDFADRADETGNLFD